ncbi:hypothetical protein ACFYOK_13105 [Microbispora bryophytorum]|uniref:hypothetical protein n=1 Tax=Microbispora bryophytorum TaxID=1460882 RepID=UPI0033F86B92
MTADHTTPDLESLRKAVAAFGGGPSLLPVLDLTAAGDRRRLLTLLNAWGCRIPYPRGGEPDPFDAAVGAWAGRGRSGGLPTAPLAELTDAELEPLGGCFAELAAIEVGRPGGARKLGPTAASKALHMLRPHTLMPWDAAIAERLHGGRGPVEYVAHQRLGRDWARGLLAMTGLDEQSLTLTLGGPGRTLAKVLDDYCYVRFTRLERL